MKYISETSITKTIRFNIHYFGLRGLRMPVLVARNCRLNELRGGVRLTDYKTGCVRIGFSGVGIFDRRCDRGIWQVTDGTVVFGRDVAIGFGSKISVAEGGTLTFGDGFRNTAKCAIICHDEVSFGACSLVSWDTLIMDTDFHCIDGAPIHAPARVGDRVWLGCRTMILKGAVVPPGSVVAAGATVTKRFTRGPVLIGGINKGIRNINHWEM
jgi:acetyltransferase-like isoleucine patch superfamily enzyme